MAEIISFKTGRTTTKTPRTKPTKDADRVLKEAKGRITSALVLGFDENGDLCIGSTMANDTAIFLMEAAKHSIFHSGDDE